MGKLERIEKMNKKWNKITEIPPPENLEIETVVWDEDGKRNEQTLKKTGTLWFTVDDGMYIYYTPTHWRHKGLTF
jgi:hypothetical protein